MRTMVNNLPGQYSMVIDISLANEVCVKAFRGTKEIVIIDHASYIKPISVTMATSTNKLTVELRTRPAIVGTIKLFFESGEIHYSHMFQTDIYHLT